jgi:hypothetical protein
MNDFVPSEGFVAKTMKKINEYEAHGILRRLLSADRIGALVLQTSVIAASLAMAAANIVRLYYIVFAPVVSH